MFQISSGLVALIALLYVACLHGTLLVSTLFYPAMDLRIAFASGLFANRAVISLHVLVCVAGPIFAIIFIVHALRNSAISRFRRLLWVPALAAGYGMIFYWYLHILPGNHRAGPA